MNQGLIVQMLILLFKKDEVRETKGKRFQTLNMQHELTNGLQRIAIQTVNKQVDDKRALT